MAMNWVRDVPFARGSATVRGYMPEMWMMTYHMLRCVGYSWIWECDGQNGIVLGALSNHVSDGNMEAPGPVTAWVATAGAPSLSKNALTYYSGTQSMEVTGQSGDIIETTLLTNPHQRATTGGFAIVSGSTMRFTKGSVMDFSDMNIGDTITFSGADNPGNDGTFTITARDSENAVQYVNGAGVADAANAGLSWYINDQLHVSIWVNNTGSQTWDVYVDPGNGTPINVGSFSGTVGWEIKHFNFTAVGMGSIKIELRPQGTSDTIYIDGVTLFKSFYEFTNDFVDYVAGDSGAYVAQTASDEFESSNYTFVMGDIGKFLVLFDASGNHPKNTGVYEVTGLSSGRAVLALRSPTAALASQNGAVDQVNWRLVDIYKWAQTVGSHLTANNMVQVYSGFGIESPDASKWRFIFRGLFTDGDANNANGCCHWSAPEDTDLDVDTGNFFKFAGPSITAPGVSRNMTLQEKNYASGSTIYGDGTHINWMRGRPGSGTYTCRQFMMFDDEGKWFFVCAVPDTNSRTAGLFGLVGEDVYHQGIERHAHMSSRDSNLSGGTTRNFMSFSIAAYPWVQGGRTIGPDGAPRVLRTGQLGIATANVHAFEMTNSQPNPFSGDEVLQKLMLVRDSTGEAGNPSEREAEGFYQGRSNIPGLTTFGSIIGLGDSLSYNPVGDVVTLSDAAGVFTAAMVDMEVTITNAPTPGNNGTFVVTGQTATTLTWVNASGASEAIPTGVWAVNMAQYLHIYNGMCIEWMEERLV